MAKKQNKRGTCFPMATIMVGVNKNVCGFVSQFFTFTVFLFQQAITLEQNVRFQCLMAYNTRDGSVGISGTSLILCKTEGAWLTHATA